MRLLLLVLPINIPKILEEFGLTIKAYERLVENPHGAISPRAERQETVEY